MDTEDLIDLVRREHGVVLDPSDPVFASATIARAVSEEDRAAVREMLDEMRKVAARQPIDQAAALDQLGKAADRVMRIHAVQYLRAGSVRNVLLATAALFAVAAACLGGGYLAGYRAAGSDQLLVACQSGQVLAAAGGRRYCAVWLDPDPAAKPR